MELLISPRTWHLAVACYSEAVHLATLLAVYTFAVRSVCRGLCSVKIYESYHRLFVVPSGIIPTMLTDSDSDSDLSSNAVKWWLLSSRGVRKYSVHPANQKRTKLGESHNLYQQLKQYPDRFHEYLWMSQSTFNYILRLIEPRIHKVYINIHKQPINAEERVEGGCGVWP
jgi:hypothetical protein